MIQWVDFLSAVSCVYYNGVPLKVNGDFSNGNMYCSCSTSDPMHKVIGTGNRDERYNIDSKVVYYTNDIDELP